MSAANSPRGCRCAACRLEAAKLLLRTGRAAMAARLLEGLGDAVREEREAAFRAGVEQGRRVAPSPRRRGRSLPPAGAGPGSSARRPSWCSMSTAWA